MLTEAVYDGEFRHGNRYDGMLTYADGSQIEFRGGERIGAPTSVIYQSRWKSLRWRGSQWFAAWGRKNDLAERSPT